MNECEKKSRNVYLIIVAILCFFFLQCTTDQVVNSGNKQQFISLSLIKEGVVKANFDGTKLDMIITFTDSVICNFNDVIKIHWIDGRFFVPDETFINKKIKKVIIPIYWINKALLPIDSSTHNHYDSIFVQVGLSKSNTLKVTVTNLSPYIDSLIVADTSFLVSPRFQAIQTFTYVVDSARDIPLRLVARDIDSKGGIKAAWENSGAIEFLVWNTISNTTRALYKKRAENFRDVITAVVYDTDASVQIKLNLKFLDGSETIIDSISFKDKTNDFIFNKPAIHHHSVQVYSLDTATIRIFPRVAGGSALWSAQNGTVIPSSDLDPNGFSVTYICKHPKAQENINTDTVIFLDSIVLLYFNEYHDDSITKSIRLYKISANKRPLIDSVLIDTVVRVNSLFHVVNEGKTIPLKIYARDPEGGVLKGTVTYSWYGNTMGTLSSLTGDSIRYSAPSGIYTDTIFCKASDSLGFYSVCAIILHGNNYPRIDSLYIDGHIKIPVSSNDSIYKYSALAPDTFSLKIHAYDYDTLGSDSIDTYIWNYKNVNKQNVISSRDSILYISDASTYTDTIVVTVRDTHKAEDRLRVIVTFLK